MTKSIFSSIRHAFLTLALGCSVLAGSAPAFALDEAETKQVEQIIRDYLLKNPELMIEVQQALEVKQQEIAKQQATAALQQNADRTASSLAGPRRDNASVMADWLGMSADDVAANESNGILE